MAPTSGTTNGKGPSMRACTCRHNDNGEVVWFDGLCPVLELHDAGDVEAQLRHEAEYEKAEREWNWSVPRGGL
jgi:hypothetical protein